MYGTIMRARVKPGLEGAADELGRRWLRERAPSVTGFIGEYLVRSADRPGEVMGLVIFDSEENYRKNAADPEQDRWYRQFRAIMEADSEWFDGEITGVTSEVVAL